MSVEGSPVVKAMAELPEPPPPPVFVADTTAPLTARVARLLEAKVAAMESALMSGGDVSVIDLARLADQVAGRVPAREDVAEYDLDRLTEEELREWARLADKARVSR